MKKSLSNQGGEIERRGDDAEAAKLALALAESEGPNDELTHGFHSYPARMHPRIARKVLELYPGEPVVDPFCGSGTVLVEARVAGRRALGLDLSPLGVRLARVKTDVRTDESRARFRVALEGIAERSEERVRTRVDARAPLPRSEIQWYAPNVLKELAGLRKEIRDIENVEDRRALEILLSSIIVKVSKQRSDTSMQMQDKRIRKGLPTELFLDKGMELLERWGALAEVASKSPSPKVIEGDALRLIERMPKKTRAGLVLTSPPYGGTYDYVDHHMRRYPWLGIDPSRMRRNELGARRDFRKGKDVKRWDQQVRQMLRSIAQVLAADAPIILLVGDAQIGDRRIDASEQLKRLANDAKLRWIASASQARPDFTGRRDRADRRESLVLLRP